MPSFDLKGAALQKLASLAAQTQHHTVSTKSFENLYAALPAGHGGSNGPTSQVGSLAKTPMTAGELQVLLALCKTAPKIDSFEAAQRFLNQLTPYFSEAHEQVFAASHVLATIEPSPWEALNFGLVSAVLAIATRHRSLHAAVAALVRQYLERAEGLVTGITASGNLGEGAGSVHAASNLDVFTMSLLGFLEAAALYCEFFDVSEQLDIGRRIRAMLNESLLVAIEGTFSAFRTSPATSKALKEKKFYISRYDGVDRPLSGMLLQQSFMRFLLSCSSMQVASVAELRKQGILDVLISRKRASRPQATSRATLALTELLTTVAADTMRILEDGSDFLELRSDEQISLAYSVKARALTIF